MNYRDIDAVNWSSLKEIRLSPKHYRHRLRVPVVQSDAMLLGTLVHEGVYEPDVFGTAYAIEPRFHAGMRDATARAKGYDGGKEAKAEWHEDVAGSGATIVPADIYLLAREIRTAILDDPISGPLVVGGYNEQTITWTDAETGEECKGRVDEVSDRLVELKTSRIISPRLFASEVVRRGYHGQVAFYLDGLAANGVTFDRSPVLICAQNEAPYDVVTYEMTDDVTAAGRALYRECLATLLDCRSRDVWLGVGGGKLMPMELPAWAAPVAEDHKFTMGGEALAI